VVALAQPDPLDALRLPAGASPSGYRNVYRKRRAWVARVKVAGRLINLSCPESGAYYHPNPRAAARLVGAWYADRYGPDWSLMFRRAPGRHGTDRRRANPWAFRHWHHVSYEGGRPRKTFAGWVVSVWEFGREKMLGDHLHPTNPRLDRAKRRPWVYPTREAAAAGLREWRAVSLPRRWGEKAASALGR
jgi:hypothetical protein